jgi:alkanesulfonate monooxygenase SsuD/methylene tetrahydromethanopterin reductase-like flavin-dependent oxidoreductase (luciferase family)
MKYAIYLPNFGAFADPNNFLEFASVAEQSGWDGLFLWDHVLLHRDSDIPMIDAWVALSAIAATTHRLRIGALVTPLARRRPWKVAREITSLDTLSRGRAIFGLGLGAPADAEFECFGEETADKIRAEKMDEAIEIVAALQSGDSVKFQGKYFKIDDVRFRPVPIQRPRVPIWVAGFHPNIRPMRRAAKWDGVFPLQAPSTGAAHVSADEVNWSTMWLSPAQLRECVELVAKYRTSMAGFDVVACGATPLGAPTDGRKLVAEHEAVGATWWIEWLDEQRGSLNQMLDHVRQGPPK